MDSGQCLSVFLRLYIASAAKCAEHLRKCVRVSAAKCAEHLRKCVRIRSKVCETLGAVLPRRSSLYVRV